MCPLNRCLEGDRGTTRELQAASEKPMNVSRQEPAPLELGKFPDFRPVFHKGLMGVLSDITSLYP